MAVLGVNGWFGSLFFRGGKDSPKVNDTQNAAPNSQVMTPDGALQLSTVWACVRLLSETIGTLPLKLYRKDTKGGQATDSSHHLYGILHDSPNADMTAAEFWETCVACLCLWGNFYAEKVRNSAGDLTALNFLQPELVTVKRDRNGSREYRYSDSRGQRVFGEDDIFHVRGFGVGRDVGLSPIGYARETLGLASDTDSAARTSFRSAVRPSGFLVVPGKPNAEQKKDLRETFIDPIVGPNATGKAGILEQGMDWKEVKGMPADDLQLLQARGFNVEELCRWFRVPPFMIGHTEKTTSWGTGLEQQMIGFLTFSLRPYLTRIEQAIRKQLVKPAERKLIFAEFVLDGLLRADSTGRAAITNAQAQNGTRTRNELRSLDNFPPLPGGDVLTVQSNLVPLDELGSAGADDQKARSAVADWLGIDAIVAAALKGNANNSDGAPAVPSE